MKYFILYIIKIYRILLSPLQAMLPGPTGCKFWPTCSEYTYQSVEKYGAPSGLWMGLKRVLKCNPWN